MRLHLSNNRQSIADHAAACERSEPLARMALQTVESNAHLHNGQITVNTLPLQQDVVDAGRAEVVVTGAMHAEQHCGAMINTDVTQICLTTHCSECVHSRR